MACQWQDEQTGGHCPDLAEHFTDTIRKWFTFTNGAHIRLRLTQAPENAPTTPAQAAAGPGRVASTANPYYALRGIRPGSALAKAAKKLHLCAPFHIGRKDWYLAANGSSTAVLKVRHKRVEEIEIANKHLTRGRRAQRADEELLLAIGDSTLVVDQRRSV